MRKLPGVIYHHCTQIIIRIAHLIPHASVSNFEIHHILIRIICKAMTITRAGSEPSTHSRGKLRFSFIGMQGRTTLQHIDEFVLSGVCVTQGGDSTRR